MFILPNSFEVNGPGLWVIQNPHPSYCCSHTQNIVFMCMVTAMASEDPFVVGFFISYASCSMSGRPATYCPTYKLEETWKMK